MNLAEHAWLEQVINKSIPIDAVDLVHINANSELAGKWMGQPASVGVISCPELYQLISRELSRRGRNYVSIPHLVVDSSHAQALFEVSQLSATLC